MRTVAFKNIVRPYLRDPVYGANEGSISTFAVVADVAGASLTSQVILIIGISSLLADGFSMAAGDFLSMRSEAAAPIACTSTTSMSRSTG